jgi:glucose-1-phosphate cytidylyltransferase
VKVVLLCGGKGTRLGELTGRRLPKPLVEIDGRPILWHIMKSYARQGYTDFVLCAGHLSEMIKQYFLHSRLFDGDMRVNTRTGNVEFLGHAEDDWSVVIADTGNETQTAGRIARVARYLDPEGPFFLTYGDGLSDIDLSKLLGFHQEHGRLATITGIAPPGRFGELNLEGTRVTELREKPEATDRFINGGFMVLDRQFVDRYCDVPGADNIMLERAPLERAAIDGELMMFPHHGFWQCMDTARDWELLEKLATGPKAPWQ